MISQTPTDIAIVGMSALFPGCKDLSSYWQNILSNVDNVHDAPDDWVGPYFDLISDASDRLYTRKGGFLRDLAQFDPIEFGIIPNSVKAGDPDHFLALKLAKDALQDAGYSDRPFNREKTGIILGRGNHMNRGGIASVQQSIILAQTLELLRQLSPGIDADTLSNIGKELQASLPPSSSDSLLGIVPNLLTGRIANRLDLMGANYVVDAACASSLIAVEQAVKELVDGSCDMMLAGGVQASTPAQIFMMFCQLNALSRSKIRPFDVNADGTLLAEGLGILVLKRLRDAQQDGDRIYAVLKAMGSSSDGKALGLLAPRLEGQVLALQRVYKHNGIEPNTVELIEAHGTGMPLGDKTEIQSLTAVFGQRQGQIPRCALGSVKSAIGHCIPAAGIAAIIKTALALYHKILPPTLCDQVNPALEIEKTPFYINTQARPWIHGDRAVPRRAGVNAFGFGGINAHALLEEYTLDTQDTKLLHKQWSTELLIFTAMERQSLLAQVQKVQRILSADVNISLANLAYTLLSLPFGTHRLAIVAQDISDLQTKLQLAQEKLTNPQCTQLQIPTGIYYTDPNLTAEPGKTAFLFPGEGSQYPNMLAELCLHFPKVRKWFDILDEDFADKSKYLPSSLIFPPPTCTTEEERHFLTTQLYSMKVAPSVLFSINLALYELLSDLGIECDVMVGHSSGEQAALAAAGILRPIERERLLQRLDYLNSVYTDLERQDKIPRGVLLSVAGIAPASIKQLVDNSFGRLHLAMDNCPNQVVLFGNEDDIDAVVTHLKAAGGICTRLPFDRAYHTSLFEGVEKAMRPYYDGLDVGEGHTPVYSCVTCEAFPSESEAISDLTVKSMSSPVRFRETIEKLYEGEQVRTFITVGPSDDLTAFVDDILRDRPILALASNSQHKSSLAQIQHLLAQLFTNGKSVNLTYLYNYRELTAIDLDAAIPIEVSPASPVLDLSMPVMRLKQDFVKSVVEMGFRGSGESGFRGSGVQGRNLKFQIQNPKSKIQNSLAPSLSQSAPNPCAVTSAISAHFELMQDFLASQARVATMFFSGAATDNNSVDVPSPSALFSHENFLLTNHKDTKNTKEEEANNLEISQEEGSSFVPVSLNQAHSLPLLGNIIERDAQHLYCERQFDIDRDVFLHDHTMGGTLSQRHPELLALPVIPFTVSMEIIAQAARSLVGGNKCVTSLYNVRGYRWLALDSGQLNLGILARLHSTDDHSSDVHVQLFELSDQTKRFLAFEGYVKLSAQFSLSPFPMTFDVGKPKTAIPGDADLYGSGIMFHGRRFQGVKHLRCCGEHGIEADLQAIAYNDFFTHIEQPVFQIDPSLLDAAGQLVGFWIAAEPQLDSQLDSTVFPFQVQSFHQYQPPLPAGSFVLCRGLIRHTNQQQTEASFDFIDPHGRLIARLEGWLDRYFTVPSNYWQCHKYPQTAYLSSPWMQAETGLVSRCIEPFPEQFFDGAWGIWKRILAHLILNAQEREFWYSLPEKGSRRTDWLLGRAAAKDAIRQWAVEYYNIELAPVDIETITTDKGKPVVHCPDLEAMGSLPDISISHSNGYVVAAVAKQNKNVGIDVEQIDCVRTDDLLYSAFTKQERELISQSDRPATIVGFWSAKEAAAKALGKGLDNPHQWCITEYSTDGAIVSHLGETFKVKWWYLGTNVIAICLI